MVPTNIEKHMMSHPAIEDVAVIGLPHDVDGERPLACVVLKQGHSATAEELINFTNGNSFLFSLFENIFRPLYFCLIY